MTGWRETNLGDVIDIYDHIRVPLSAAQRATRKGPYPYYGAQGIIDYLDDYLFDGRYLLIPEDGENLNSRKLPIAYFADGKFWVNNHAHIVRGKPGLADDVFLKHALNGKDISGYITGAAQPKLSQANLKRMVFDLPPLETQQRIAAILGAYDDLIEVNRRRVAVLEEMARGLFEEWFVRFRFPGHEDVPIVDTADGALPDGWETSKLSEHVKASYGFTQSATDEPIGPKFVRVKDINKAPYIDWKAVPYAPFEGDKARYALEPGDLVVGRMADVGKVGLIDREIDAIAASYLVRMRPLNRKQYLFFYFLTSAPSYLNYVTGASTGTTRKSAGLPVLTGYKFAMPPDEVIDRFVTLVKPIRDLGSTLVRSNADLSASRDLLLPRLISGQLSVEAAERELEDAA